MRPPEPDNSTEQEHAADIEAGADRPPVTPLWGPDASRRRFLLIAAGIVALGLLLRLYRIDRYELWCDEAFSYGMAALPHWLARAQVDANPPLYYLLLRGWVRVAGDSEAALRLLSAGFGTLAVAAVIWVGRLVLSPPVGLWAGAFAAVAPLHVYYSQEARTYTLLTLALLLTAGATWRALAREGWGAWALVAAGATVALYSHYFALLGLLPVAALLLLWPDRAQARRAWPKAGAAAAAAGLLFLPWVVWALGFRPPSLGQVWWIRGIWEQERLLFAIPRSLEMIGLGGQGKPIWVTILDQGDHSPYPPLRLLSLMVLALLGAWIAVPWGDARLGVPWLGRRKAWLWTLLLFPLVGLWALSLWTPLYVVGRYDLLGFPAYAVLIGLALAKAQHHLAPRMGRIAGRMIALGLLVVAGPGLASYYQTPAQRYAEATAVALDRSVANGDVVVVIGFCSLPVIYYLHRLGYEWENLTCRNDATGRQFSCRLFPRGFEERYAPRVTTVEARGLSSIELIREDIQDYMQALRPDGGSVWVVLGSYTISQDGNVIGSTRDADLLREISRLGFEIRPHRMLPGIFQLRRT